MSGNKTATEQRQYVVKSNDLIRKTRYSMTTQQQKIVLYAISKIKPSDPQSTVYQLEVEDLCRACGLNYQDGGYYYSAIKNDIQALTQRIWVKMPDGSERTVSWIGDAEIAPNSGSISIRFHPAMTPYLFELKTNYTQYRLENVLAFKGKYTIRLYELLRSHMTQRSIDNYKEKSVSFSVSELREILDVSKYEKWSEFNRNVLKKAVEEINAYCEEIHVDYETFKDGRQISLINFIITVPRPMEKMIAKGNRRKRL